MSSLDLTGHRYGRLCVVRYAGRKSIGKGKFRTLWECLCDCGNTKIVPTLSLRVPKGGTKSCGCLRRDVARKDLWKGHGEIGRSYWSRARDGAEERNLEFSITIEYAWELFLSQRRRCALTGVELRFAHIGNKSYKGDCTASLDRIDSTKGYIPGNVQWVHKRINKMKMDLTEEEFAYWCDLVAKHRTIKDDASLAECA